MVNRFEMPKLSEIRKLAEEFAKARGQEGRRISEKDMQRALEVIHNRQKKFMRSR